MRGGGGQDVIAGIREAADGGEIDQAPLCATASEHGDDVDGFGNHRARHCDDGFLDKLFKPAKRAERGAGMYGADAAGMSGTPGFQKVQRLRAADLADGNAVRPQAK